MDSYTLDLLAPVQLPPAKTVGSVSRQNSAITMPPRLPVQTGLDPYTGEWKIQQAKHLLSRTMFGPTRGQIVNAVDKGMQDMVEILLTDLPLPEPPLNYNFPSDIFTEIGETWIDKPTIEIYIQYRQQSLAAWVMQQLLDEGVNIREKMTLFWHNHFVTSDIPLPQFTYQNLNLLRENALGNFKELTKKVTIDPSMLFYLNGNDNNKFAPNENYARELLELFTVGKGELAGPGDYSTFTEDDVREIARVLTGWRIGYNPETGEMPSAFFNIFLHDEGQKTLSHRFGNAVINNANAEEYSNLINLIFQQEAASLHICRKLYRWFVYYEIDEMIEQNVIAPMAQILRDNNFEVKPVLRALLSSEHFYDINSIGCIIKHPIEFMVTATKQFEVNTTTPNIGLNGALWLGIYRAGETLQMNYLNPPDVAGWKAWYQAPSFFQLWINSATLPLRFLFTDVFATIGYNIADYRFGVNALEFTQQLDNPLNPNDLIIEVANLIYPFGVSEEQLDYLKEVLIPGLPDFEWTVEYSAYLNNPTDPVIRLTVQSKLQNLYRAMLSLPEYQLA